jgi:DNA-binding transcriptional MerR regulator
MKRRGNRRYYQHHEVLMIRRIRELLYEQGFTIIGARNKLQELNQIERDRRRDGEVALEGLDVIESASDEFDDFEESGLQDDDATNYQKLHLIRLELFEIRELLSVSR